MKEHKKTHSTSKDWLGNTVHEYTDGVHTGRSIDKELANDAYQAAKREDITHADFASKEGKIDSFMWNTRGKPVDRSSDDDSSSSSSSDSSSSGK